MSDPPRRRVYESGLQTPAMRAAALAKRFRRDFDSGGEIEGCIREAIEAAENAVWDFCLAALGTDEPDDLILPEQPAGEAAT